VSNIKALSNGKPAKKLSRGRKRGRADAAPRSSTAGSVKLVTLTAVKKLVAEVGSATAHQLIDLLA
jgi:hypothetical protein